MPNLEDYPRVSTMGLATQASTGLIWQYHPTSAGGVINLAPGTPVKPTNTQPPVVSGKATVGELVACSQGAWANEPTSYTYQWQSKAVNVAGATQPTYVPAKSDVGNLLTCIVTATNSAGSNTATSNSFGPVQQGQGPNVAVVITPG